MLTQTEIQFAIMLLLILGAIIAFCYFVLKPLQVHWARKRAREILHAGKVRNYWRFHNIYRILAMSGPDLEAQYLWHRLNELKEQSARRE